MPGEGSWDGSATSSTIVLGLYSQILQLFPARCENWSTTRVALQKERNRNIVVEIDWATKWRHGTERDHCKAPEAGFSFWGCL